MGRKLKPDKKLAAQDFQRMIRIEAAALDRPVWCVQEGRIAYLPSPLGYNVCVTCGRRYVWDSGKIDAGHYLTGWSVKLEEDNCHPQSVYCNQYNSGMRECYMLYMTEVIGQAGIDRLVKLKATPFETTPDELIERRKEYRRRIAIAREKLG